MLRISYYVSASSLDMDERRPYVAASFYVFDVFHSVSSCITAMKWQDGREPGSCGWKPVKDPIPGEVRGRQSIMTWLWGPSVEITIYRVVLAMIPMLEPGSEATAEAENSQ